jgi:eukaryotic-like serine/threonine-protein kinase
VNPGDVISRYRIISLIGKGGMGMVYRAEDTRLQRQVALKFLPHEGFSEQARNRFLNEARAAAKARHPNICPIHDIEESDGELFLVMAYIEGETLQRKIAQRPLDPQEAIELAIQIASGLACAHGLGVVHRDIKSSNIMVDRNSHASILDFGLALVPDTYRLTHAGTSVGTPAYMSPEQIEGREVDARTDLWSLGIVMFEMLTGSMPFRRDQSAAVVHAVLHDPLPAISSLRRGVPPELVRIIEKALARDVAHRWESASEMVTELKRIAELKHIGASDSFPMPAETVTQTMAMPRSTTGRRKQGIIAAIAAAAVALLGIGGWLVYKSAYMSRTVTPTTTSGIASAAPQQIAILPFQVTSSEPEPAASRIPDGLLEVLASALSAEGGRNAVGPTELRSRHVTTIDEARQVYGVSQAITGSARQVGDKIEFTARLVDVRSLAQIAERSFVYDPKDPLGSRDRAIAQVAEMMKLDVQAAVRSQSGDAPAPSAYSAYLEGRGFLARYDLPGNVERAIASFTSATQQDPKYALAYSGLGEAYLRKASSTGDQQWTTLAHQNAEQSVRLDGNLAIAHSVLGSVYLDQGRQEDAIRELQRSMDLAPANAEAPRKLAAIYSTQGRFDEAEALYLRSTKSRPTDWYGYLLLGVFYYGRQRYPEAEAALIQAKSLSPDNDLIRVDLGGIYRMHGRYQDAIAEYQQALKIRSSADTYAGLGGAYYYEHRFQEAVRAVEAAIDLDSNDYRFWGNLGIYCHWAPGNEQKSETALRRAIELATKFAQATKSDYSVHANLAEYRARLGDAKGSLAEIEQIPVSARGPFTTRLAIVYVLTNHRDKAIEVIRTNLKSAASLNQIKDDPDLAALWRDGKLQ